jgi:hypothetical protein
MSSVSIVGALATTLMFLFPPLYLPVLVVSGLVSVALVATAIGYWFDYTFNEHKKTPVTKPSYEAISSGLGPSLKLEETLEKDPEPYHGKGLLTPAPIYQEEIELTTLADFSAPLSCNL